MRTPILRQFQRKGVALSCTFAIALLQAYSAFAAPSGGLLDGNMGKIRIIITSDIDGTDANDEQSFGHFLIYSYLFDVEGLITSAPKGKTSGFLAGINAYEKDYEKLKTWSADYPTPQHLRSVVKAGKTTKGMGSLNDGARLIISAAKKSDPRPLHIVAWGSTTNEAIALKNDPSIASKLRIHAIGPWNRTNGDSEANNYMKNNFANKLWWIIDRHTFRGASCGGEQSGDYSNSSFSNAHVKGHGALGNWTNSVKIGLKLNQSNTILYLLKGDPSDPTAEHWGGSFDLNTDKAAGSSTFWSDKSCCSCGKHNGAGTVNKWRKEWLDSWAQHMDRCLAAKDGSTPVSTPEPTPEPDPTPIAGDGFVEKNGIVCFEAEHFTSKKNFKEVSVSGASGGKAMKWTSADCSLDFEFSVSSGGTWYLYHRGKASDHHQNSIQMKLDGSAVKAPPDDVNSGMKRMYMGKGGFSWNSYWQGKKHGGRSWPIKIEISQGTHTLSIIKDAANSPAIDKIVLSKTEITIGRSAPSTLGSYGKLGPEETTGGAVVRTVPASKSYGNAGIRLHNGWLHIGGDSNAPYSLSVVSPRGRILKNVNGQERSFYIGSMAKGVYFVKLRQDGAAETLHRISAE